MQATEAEIKQRMQNFFELMNERSLELHNGEEKVVPDSVNGKSAHFTRANKIVDPCDSPLKGKLYKYSPSLFGGWQERWF